MSGEADDLQITLEDRDHVWIGSWMPDEGAKLTASIVRENWVTDGKTDKVSLGQFEIDEIESEFPPSTVTIKATSIPQSSSLRGEEKNRAWEKTKLSIVARDIAAGAKMKYFYDTDDNPDYDRIDQSGETDLKFLMRICTDAGLCLKVSDNQIVIFDERKYEAKKSFMTITKGKIDLKSYSGRRTLNGIYKSCKVVYHDSSENKTISSTYTPAKPPKTGRVLFVNERVKTVAEAQRLAKKRLRDANKQAVSFSMSMPGDIRFFASLTVDLVGFGKFDGKYIITQATHSQSTGYETKLQLRKCLEGY
jgi:phage protein D